jgi:hypothetical protein
VLEGQGQEPSSPEDAISATIAASTLTQTQYRQLTHV